MTITLPRWGWLSSYLATGSAPETEEDGQHSEQVTYTKRLQGWLFLLLPLEQCLNPIQLAVNSEDAFSWGTSRFREQRSWRP